MSTIEGKSSHSSSLIHQFPLPWYFNRKPSPGCLSTYLCGLVEEAWEAATCSGVAESSAGVTRCLLPWPNVLFRSVTRCPFAFPLQSSAAILWGQPPHSRTEKLHHWIPLPLKEGNLSSFNTSNQQCTCTGHNDHKRKTWAWFCFCTSSLLLKWKTC